MTQSNAPTSREERLAARLRDNLKRRKAQARALNDHADNAQAGVQVETPQSDDAATGDAGTGRIA